MSLSGGSALLFLIGYPSFLSAMLALCVIYRLVNLGRIVNARMQPQHLFRTSWRSVCWLIGYEVILIGLWAACHASHLMLARFWTFFLVLELLTAVILLVTTLKHSQTMRPAVITDWQANNDLPTLSVAIPARNETTDLEACLSSLVASTYPKLEILVLDDCSTTKRTPAIIRGFAHDGVRFIQGQPPQPGWLAKNQAYQTLQEAANGELILFCGADVQFEPETLTRIVTLMLQKKKSMMSIMPRNILPRFLQPDALLIQAMRYAWEVALPRKLFRRPPVLSTCWIVKRSLLETAGGFSAVSRSILPEGYFARQSVRHDGYGFRYSNAMIGLTSHKDIADQRDTATRTKYPQLHRRPELVLVMTVAELFGLVMPFMFLVVGIYTTLNWVLILSVITCAVLVAWYLLVCAITYRKSDVRALVSLPFAALLDVALLNYSMLKYEFSVVLWKDRNVCIPVMHVDSELKLPPSSSSAQ
jgi:glycosyltransferase involved in cell wall biosynthesis